MNEFYYFFYHFYRKEWLTIMAKNSLTDLISNAKKQGEKERAEYDRQAYLRQQRLTKGYARDMDGDEVDDRYFDQNGDAIDDRYQLIDADGDGVPQLYDRNDYDEFER